MYKIILDPEDSEKYGLHNMVIIVRKNGYAYVMFSIGPNRGKMVSRIIMNCPACFQIDHKNRNALDCRKSNMRLAEPHENSANTLGHKNKSSELPKGVYKSKCGYYAQITHKRIRYSLGSFITVEEASEAYKNKAKEFNGVFCPRD